jgi:hypothetical protein
MTLASRRVANVKFITQCMRNGNDNQRTCSRSYGFLLIMISRYLFLSAILFTAVANAGDSTLDAAIGGGLGGAAGAAIGNEVGGREGAIVGGALGAGVGAAVTTDSATHKV